MTADRLEKLDLAGLRADGLGGLFFFGFKTGDLVRQRAEKHREFGLRLLQANIVLIAFGDDRLQFPHLLFVALG